MFYLTFSLFPKLDISLWGYKAYRVRWRQLETIRIIVRRSLSARSLPGHSRRLWHVPACRLTGHSLTLCPVRPRAHGFLKDGHWQLSQLETNVASEPQQIEMFSFWEWSHFADSFFVTRGTPRTKSAPTISRNKEVFINSGSIILRYLVSS
jgi:hypothetical protein